MSSSAQVVAIFISPNKGAPMQSPQTVQAVAGSGLRGDRYFKKGDGTFYKDGQPRRHVTLFEAEAIEAVAEASGVRLEPKELRRNVMVRGVRLNPLVGKEFTVGGLRLKGAELCEPCGYLEKLTVPGMMAAYMGQAGIRAEILEGGTLAVGDALQINL